jgi:hypothetical protein
VNQQSPSIRKQLKPIIWKPKSPHFCRAPMANRNGFNTSALSFASLLTDQLLCADALAELSITSKFR